MRFLICYDITDDYRRERVARLLLDFGRRIQESVFLATLDAELFERMVARLEAAISATSDTVHVFSLCGPCMAKARVMGVAQLPEDLEFYVV